MEVLVGKVLGIILWCIATYWLVNRINKDESSEFTANPWTYVLLTALFGVAMSMAFLLGNKFKFENKTTAKNVCYGIGIVLAIFSILIAFI